jgi:hypothetical protein
MYPTLPCPVKAAPRMYRSPDSSGPRPAAAEPDLDNTGPVREHGRAMRYLTSLLLIT